MNNAKQLGAQAFARGAMRVPAHDPAIAQAIKGKTGAEVSKILGDWLSGWDKANLSAPVPEWSNDENLALTAARAFAKDKKFEGYVEKVRTALPSGKLVGFVEVGKTAYAIVHSPARATDLISGFYLVGVRGAHYALWKNAKNPEMLFPINLKGNAGALKDRWFRVQGNTVVFHH